MINMTGFDRMKNLLNQTTTGIISTKEIFKENISRDVLNQFINNGELVKYGRGLYTIHNAWEDEFYILQQKYSKGIYSYDTAL